MLHAGKQTTLDFRVHAIVFRIFFLLHYAVERCMGFDGTRYALSSLPTVDMQRDHWLPHYIYSFMSLEYRDNK